MTMRIIMGLESTRGSQLQRSRIVQIGATEFFAFT